MPKKVLPTQADFDRIRRELLKLGFRPIYRSEVGRAIRRLDLSPPRKNKGREAGFTFTANQLTVKVWTTWLPDQNRARDSDEGWVLIESGDDADYFSHPLHRTKNFVDNLLRQAWIARFRVKNRPLCRKCNQFMQIREGKALKSRYWSCDALHRDGKYFRLDWDENLPPKALRYVRNVRKKRAQGREQRSAEGKPEKPALLRRKTWRSRPRTKSSA